MFSGLDSLRVIAWIAFTFLAFIATVAVLQGRIADARYDGHIEVSSAANGISVILHDADESAAEREAQPSGPALVGDSEDGPLALATDQLTFHSNPALLVWLALVSGMVALAAALVPLLFHVARSLRKPPLPRVVRSRRHRFALAVAGAIAFLGVAVPLKYSSDFPGLVAPAQWYEWLGIGFSSPTDTVWWLSILAAIPGVMALFGLFLASHTADDLALGLDQAKDPRSEMDAILKRFGDVKFTLRLCLASISVMLVMAILTTAALREALLAAVEYRHPWIAPAEFVYLYGLLFAVVLAIVYLPVYVHVRHVGQRMFERMQSVPRSDAHAPASVDGKDEEDRNRELSIAENVLTGQESVGSKLLSWGSIAAPVVGAVLPDLISLT